MKTWKLLPAAILSIGLLGAWGLIGCGGDDCEDACNQIHDCNSLWMTGTTTVDACTSKCHDHFKEAECILDCDTDASCGDYANCVLHSCNPPPPE